MEILDLRVKPVTFDPAVFFDGDYKIEPTHRETRIENQGEINFASEVDVTYVQPQEGHAGEKMTCGQAFERLYGHEQFALYGADVAYGLYQNWLERGTHSVLESLNADKGIDKLHFFGDVVTNSLGESSILVLMRADRTEAHDQMKWHLLLCSITTWPFEAFVPAKPIPATMQDAEPAPIVPGILGSRDLPAPDLAEVSGLVAEVLAKENGSAKH